MGPCIPFSFLWKYLILCSIYRDPMYTPLGCTPISVLSLKMPLPGRWLWTSPYITYFPRATVKLWKIVTSWKLIYIVIKITLTIKNLECSNMLVYSNVKWGREEVLDHVLYSLYIIKKKIITNHQPTKKKNKTKNKTKPTKQTKTTTKTQSMQMLKRK